MREPLKRYIIRKYVMARSVADAVKKEKVIKPDDCWLDDNWKTQLPPAIGFAPYD